MLYNFEAAILRSNGNTRTPLICLFIGGVFNVAANLFFVLVLGMDVDGVAIATVLANVISSMMLLHFLRTENSVIHVNVAKIRMNRDDLRTILRIGMPAGLQSAVFSISNICIQSAINSLGATYMAASSAAFNIEIFVFFVVNAFTQTLVTFVGQNYGAGKYDRVRQSVRQGFIITAIFTIMLSTFMYIFRMPLLSLFTTEEDVLAFGDVMMCAMVPYYILYISVEMCSGALRGMGEAIIPTILTLTGVCLLRVAWIMYALPLRNQITTVVYSYPITWTVTSVMFLIYYFFTSGKKLKRTPSL
jgi:putative MATE family efflux protein